MASAIRILQADLGCIVTYEDPSREDAAGTIELFLGRRVPATRAVSFEVHAGKTAKQAVQDLVAAYSRQDDSVVYEVREGEEGSGTLNVVPVKHLTGQGQMVPDHSLLNAKISLSATDETYQAVVDRICELVSQQRGKKLWGPPPPTREFTREKISISIDNKTALWCLNEVFAKCNRENTVKASWRLPRDPKDDFCALVVFRLPAASEAAMPTTAIAPSRYLADKDSGFSRGQLPPAMRTEPIVSRLKS